MKPIRTEQDRGKAISDIAKLRKLAEDKGYRFGTAHDDAEERLEALKKREDEAKGDL